MGCGLTHPLEDTPLVVAVSKGTVSELIGILAFWSDLGCALAFCSGMTKYGFRGSVRVQKSILSYILYHKR